jgi:hypothetical protein
VPRFAAARYNFERLTLDQVIERWATFYAIQIFGIEMTFFERRRLDHDFGTILSRRNETYQPVFVSAPMKSSMVEAWPERRPYRKSSPVVPVVRQNTVEDLVAKFKRAAH